MDYCAFQPLQDAFGPGVRCSNYQEVTTDGVKDLTSWFYNKAGTSLLFPDDTDAYDTIYNQDDGFTLAFEYPRAWIMRLDAANLMEEGNGDDRWWTVSGKTFGTIDAPMLYPIEDSSWEGSELNETRGHWSPTPYVPIELQHPAADHYWWTEADSDPDWHWSPAQETKAQTRLRLDRHTIESAINSFGGDRQGVTGPWLNQYIAVEASNEVYLKAERDQRMVLAMLRAKRVPYHVFWFNHRDTVYPPTDQQQAWQNTEDLVRRVYAAFVSDVKHYAGTPQESFEPDMLETTLRIPETIVDYVLSVDAEPDISGGEFFSSTGVVIDGLAEYRTGYFYEINLECTGPEGMKGQLQVYDHEHDAWHIVLPLDYQSPETTYLFANTVYGSETASVRRTFYLQAEHPGDYITEGGQMELRFQHDWIAPEPGWEDPVTTRFDLVQVIPVQAVYEGFQDPPEALIADTNGNGVTNETDLLTFINGYISEAAYADLDRDNAVTESDLNRYINAYVNEE